MRILVLLSLACLLPRLLSAADSSVPVDGNGYLDDRKLQAPAESKPAEKKKPKKVIDEEAAEEAPPLLTQVSTGSSGAGEEAVPVLPIAIGVLVLAALAGAGIFMARRKTSASSAPSSPAPPPPAAPPQPRSPTAASLSRPPTQANVKLPPASGGQSEGLSINGLSSNEIARLTSIDERGRNPSGIIIDEDKYFSGGKESFVDEDKS
ncbi:MAG: hypothetical protein RL095_885 [Verrucomicrobiota bacterium]|jgi:hypothetical protein